MSVATWLTLNIYSTSRRTWDPRGHRDALTGRMYSLWADLQVLQPRLKIPPSRSSAHHGKLSTHAERYRGKICISRRLGTVSQYRDNLVKSRIL